MASLQVPEELVLSGVTEAERMHREQALLKTHFPEFQLVRERSAQNYVAQGVLSTHVNLYAVRVRAPLNYPYVMPDIIPVAWKATGPHTYSSGNLCVMQADQWRNSYSLALLVAKAAIWVNKYELYQETGEWPGNEQFHDLGIIRSIRKWWNET
jgi:hypothetical protein